MSISESYKPINSWFMVFAQENKFQLPINRKENDDYIKSLEMLYKDYLQYINSGPLDIKLKEDISKLCSLIIKILEEKDVSTKNNDMDEIIRNYIESHHTMTCYVIAKKVTVD